jgi:hypothetical protein
MPLQPIFDQEGVTASWLNDNSVIHDLDGEAVAFVRANAVYDYDGEQLGWFQNGFSRDDAGDAIAFMNGHVGGPLPPLHELPPLPPIPAIPPIPHPGDSRNTTTTLIELVRRNLGSIHAN